MYIVNMNRKMFFIYMTTAIVKKNKKKTSTRKKITIAILHGIKCSVFFAMVANVVPVMTQTRKHGIVKSNPRVYRLDKEGL